MISIGFSIYLCFTIYDLRFWIPPLNLVNLGPSQNPIFGQIVIFHIFAKIKKQRFYENANFLFFQFLQNLEFSQKWKKWKIAFFDISQKLKKFKFAVFAKIQNFAKSHFSVFSIFLKFGIFTKT
jgi:hypothetical protein